MICKFCFAEVEDGAEVCSVCGKNLTEPEAETQPIPENMEQEELEAAVVAEEESAPEEAPAKKKGRKGKVLVTVLAAVGVLILAFFLTYAVLKANPTEGTKAFVEKMDKATHSLKFWRENDIYYKTSYTAEEEKLNKNQDVVVAKVGNQTLTLGELQAHYWMSVFDFVNYYGSYLGMMGTDFSKPLNELVYEEETGMTYQQMFLENALESWRRYATLVQMSEDNGFTLNEEQQAELDTFPDYFKELAAEYGYEDTDSFISKEFFPGCSLDSYLKYNSISYKAVCYFDTIYESMVPTQDQIEAYYQEHEAEFVEQNLGKENGNYYDVRHILIAIEGGTEAEDGSIVYSDAEWEACRAAAQKVLDDFLANEPTEEKFAALAKEKSQDPGSASNGGLYSELTKDTGFIEDFTNWYLDESRTVGDTGLVKNTQSSTQGYHIMYFSGSKPMWEYEAKNAILSDNTSALLEETENKLPMEVNYKKILLGHVNLAAE